jgi:hypothetical protein
MEPEEHAASEDHSGACSKQTENQPNLQTRKQTSQVRGASAKDVHVSAKDVNACM